MEKRLNVAQFKKLVEGQERSYWLSSSDQDGFQFRDRPHKIKIRFDRIIVTSCPWTICLIADNGNVVFQCVRYVIVEIDSNGFETYKIICNNYCSDTTSEYVLRTL